MLKKFVLSNYKNFKDEVAIDFQKVAGYQFNTDCLSDGLICKMLIYGRNATGKTNLGEALFDISLTILGNRRSTRNGVLLNADSKENVAKFRYEFSFDNSDLTYEYSRFANMNLRDEKLSLNNECIFECDFSSNEFSFDKLNLIDAETAVVERFTESLNADGEETMGESGLPFLRWLISNVALKKDSLLLRLNEYVKGMYQIKVSAGLQLRGGIFFQGFYESLENPERLKDFEDFLNAMGIECQLVLRRLPDGQRELYFAHEQLVPFYENASSGTLALADLYRRLIFPAREASLIYLDEFDAFYHYEMAENVILFFKEKYPRCQIIMTSYNTNLMTNRIMRPDCLFILSRRGTLTALCDATGRELREGHNLEKMYIGGEFESYE